MSRTVSMEVFLISLLAVAFLFFAEASSTCDPTEFKCSNGMCISKIRVYDGVSDDCGDNFDEKVCVPYHCHPFSFQCLNGKCITRLWFCNRDDNYWDNSDERYCRGFHELFMANVCIEILKVLHTSQHIKSEKEDELSVTRPLHPRPAGGLHGPERLLRRRPGSGVATEGGDSQALSSMALSCISSRSGVSVDETTLMDMLQELKRRQFRNGTVDNFRTTALVTQTLFIHDSFKKDFDLDSAMKVLVDGLNGNKSLLEAYYALPVLNRKSLLNVTSGHCSKQPVAEEEALQNALDVRGETITVQYSVWMGDEINLGRTWRLRMRVNSTIYDAIETVAKIYNRQKIEYNVVDGKPYVAALDGKEDDPEMGMFWFVYLKTVSSDKDPKIVEESISF
ncbi:hypothetical protein AVEN_92060-1 [Araneus ventricosus]|uniref:Uncharacterized protein n=1 Tax=Araneus ventricosus TaxID=182803 RepID=A0A4Y2INC3_ARAVE|nr:hypothetical protein AVEN_92060-1 [Araneus ventricosus]